LRIGSRLRDRVVWLCLHAPSGKEIARRPAIETVIEFREVVYALHRMAHRKADQQNVLEYPDRHAGCLCGDGQRFSRRIMEYALA
jgi:hypothetical protein